MELKLKYNLKDELTFRNGLIFSFTSLEDMKKKFYNKFKEQEKARGYGLNTFVRPVSDDFEILENDEIALVGQEEEFDFNMFLEEVEKAETIEEVVPYSPSNPFLEALQEVSQQESTSIEEAKGSDEPHNWGINEDYHEIIAPLPKKPKVKEKIYTNLVEFIKDNPNCTVQDASKFFKNKEIQKQIKMGKVFLRRGRLSV